MNDLQINRLSEIMGNLSLLFLGSLVLPGLVGSEMLSTGRIAIGLIGGISSVILSLFLLKGGKS